MKSAIAILLTTLTSVMASSGSIHYIYISNGQTSSPYYNFYHGSSGSSCDVADLMTTSTIGGSQQVGIPPNSEIIFGRCDGATTHPFEFDTNGDGNYDSGSVSGSTTQTLNSGVDGTTYEWQCDWHPKSSAGAMYGTFLVQAESHDSPSPAPESSTSPSSITFDSSDYELCSGNTASVVFNGNHNICEVTEAIFLDTSSYSANNYCTGGIERAGFHSPSLTAVSVSELGADEGQTRYFICSAHPGAKFSVSCPPSSSGDSSSSSSGDSSQCSTYATLNRDYDSSAPVCPDGTIASGDLAGATYCQCTACSQIEVYMAAEGEVCNNGNWAQTPPKAKCDSFTQCPANTVLIAAANSTDCDGDPCVLAVDETTCCVAKDTCDNYACVGAHKENFGRGQGMYCNGATCSFDNGDELECCGCKAGFGWYNDQNQGSCTECTAADPPQWNAAIDHSPCGNHTGCPSSSQYFDYERDTNVGVCKSCATGTATSADPFADSCNECASGYTKVGSTCVEDKNCVGSWSEWSECPSCGPANTMQTRSFSVTTPAQGSGICEASNGDTAIRECENLSPCPINCVGSWSTWSECSAQCGGGKQTKTYTVTQSAQHGGASCTNFLGHEMSDGDLYEQDCNIDPCKATCDTFTCPSGFSKKTDPDPATIECAGAACSPVAADHSDTSGTNYGQGAAELDLHRCCDYNNADFTYVSHTREENTGAWKSAANGGSGCLSDKCYEKSQVHGHKVCNWGSGACNKCDYCETFEAGLPAANKFDDDHDNCAASCRNYLYDSTKEGFCAWSNCKGCEYCSDTYYDKFATKTGCDAKCSKYYGLGAMGNTRYENFCLWSSCRGCQFCNEERTTRETTKYATKAGCDAKCSRYYELGAMGNTRYANFCLWGSCTQCTQCQTEKTSRETTNFATKAGCDAKCSRYHELRIMGNTRYANFCLWGSCRQCTLCKNNLQSVNTRLRSAESRAEPSRAEFLKDSRIDMEPSRADFLKDSRIDMEPSRAEFLKDSRINE